jgi:DNA invertase Pin-like site-specific DNA recombinase
MLTLDEHRRDIKIERAHLGRQRAMEAGVKFGRPQVSETKLQAVRQALGAGAGIRPAARLTGVSPAKVLQVKRAMLEVQPSN